MTEKEIGTYALGGALGLFLLVSFLGSFYTIETGTVGVLSTWGEYEKEESLAGLRWKIPFVQEVFREDVKMQTVNYKYNDGGYGKIDEGLFLRPQISILDSKNLPIGIDLTLQFTPNAADMSFILETFGTNYLEKKINPVIRDVVRDVASKYEAENIATQREEIGKAINVALATEFDAMPFALNNIAIRGITLPQSVQKKVMEVQEAKQEEQRLGMKEKQAAVNKRIAIIDAQKTAEVKIENARGVAQSIKVTSIEQARANQRVAASLTDKLIRQNEIDRWNGVVAKYQLGGGNTGLLLGVDTK